MPDTTLNGNCQEIFNTFSIYGAFNNASVPRRRMDVCIVVSEAVVVVVIDIASAWGSGSVSASNLVLPAAAKGIALAKGSHR
jgi:hypothetical protein